MKLEIHSSLELICYLDYISNIQLSIDEIFYFFKFLKRNILFFKNTYALKYFDYILQDNFFSNHCLFNRFNLNLQSYFYLNKILVEDNYFEDLELQLYFKESLSEMKFRLTYRFNEDF